MRVIAGTARGTQLQALPGTDITRPTIDRVKEAMFSAVPFMLPGARVLDLFAGSGQLGIEALSRGAQRCVFLDENHAAAQVVAQNLKAAGLFGQASVSNMGAEAFLAATKEQFDMVLLDPPYHHNTLAVVLPAVDAVLAPGGIALCESEPGALLPETVGALVRQKQYRYGKVQVTKYQKPYADEEAQL